MPPLRSIAGNLAAGLDVAAGGFDILTVTTGHDAVIHDTGYRREYRLDAAAVRFAFADPGFVDDFEARDAVRDAALVELVQVLELALLGSNDQFADVFVRNLLRVAILPERFAAFDTELGLERPRLIVDPRVDHAGVVAGLVRRQDVLFLEDDQLEVGVAGEEFAPGRQADDAAPDDRDVVRHMRGNSRMGGGGPLPE